MTYVIWLAVAVAALFSPAAWLAIWSRRDTWARPAAVLLFILGLPIIAAVAAESLGWHKPIVLAWGEANGQFVMRYEPSVDTHAPQFHPLPQPPALPRKPTPPAAPRFEQGV